jgi:hypothetical protein
LTTTVSETDLPLSNETGACESRFGSWSPVEQRWMAAEAIHDQTQLRRAHLVRGPDFPERCQLEKKNHLKGSKEK